MRLDAPEYVQSQAVTSTQRHAAAATESPASEVNAASTPDRRPTRGRPAQLRELVGDWTWQTDHDDRQPEPSVAESGSRSTKDQLIRAFAWARILIG
jgi:hypothetical protein